MFLIDNYEFIYYKIYQLGSTSVSIIQKTRDLQHFEKGRICCADEIISRIGLIVLVKNFYNFYIHPCVFSSLTKKLFCFSFC